MNFFDGLDLDSTKTEKPIFKTSEEVVLGVNAVEEKTNEYGTALYVDCKILNTNHEGKTLTIRLDPVPKTETKKSMLIGILSALYGDNWVSTARQNLSSGVGKKFSAIALEPREFQGKKFQYFTAIRPTNTTPKSTVDLNNLPF